MNRQIAIGILPSHERRRVCIQLEHMLRKANPPSYLYDDIMQWAFLNKNIIPSNVPAPITSKTLYAEMSCKIYGNIADDMKPREIQTILPSGCCYASISTFDVYSQVVQLLGNTNTNEWTNYFFSLTCEDSFHLNIFSDWNTSKFDGLETSVWYKQVQTN